MSDVIKTYWVRQITYPRLGPGDGENRLIEVETATATTAYGYAPDGDRIRTVVTPVSGPGETSFILGPTEIDNAGTYTKIPHADVRIGTVHSGSDSGLASASGFA